MTGFDQAQSSRLGQHAPVETTSIRMFSGAEIPEAAWAGQMIYRTDTQKIQVFNGTAWEEVVGGTAGLLTFVGPETPVSQNAGDLWFDSSDLNHPYRAEVAGASIIGPGFWESIRDLKIEEVQDQVVAVEVKFPITETEIADEAITTPKLATGSIVVGGGDAVTFAPGYDPSTKAEITALDDYVTDAELGDYLTIEDLSGINQQIASAAGDAPNPYFDLWPDGQTYPTYYGAGAGTPVRETSIIRTPAYSLRFNVASGTDAYILPTTTYSGSTDFLTVTADVRLISGTWTGAGVLVRWRNTGGGVFDASMQFVSVLAGKGTGSWYRAQMVIQRPTNFTGTFSDIQVIPVGGYTTWGSVSAKNILFDQVNARASTVEEIKAWTAGLWVYPGTTTINGGMLRTGTVVADFLTATAVSSINISASQITSGTISSNRITTNSLSGAQITGDQINGGVITGATLRTSSGQSRVELSTDDVSSIRFHTVLSIDTDPAKIQGDLFDLNFYSPGAGPDYRKARMFMRSGTFPSITFSSAQSFNYPLQSTFEGGLEVLGNGTDNAGMLWVDQTTTTGQLHMTNPNSGSNGTEVLWQSGNTRLVVVTSSRRFKYDIEDLELDLEAAYALTPKRSHRYDAENPDDWFVGFIAEEAKDLGLEPWVLYDTDGEVFSFSYREWPIAQQMMLRDLKQRVEALENGS